MNPRARSWSSRRALCAVVLSALSLVSCASQESESTGAVADTSAVVLSGDVPDFANATYRGIDVADGDLTLVDGKWEAPDRDGMSGGWVSLSSAELRGDLDDDGEDEVVVMLDASGGGSGMFTYMTVFARREGGWVQIADPVTLGDRIEFRDQRVEPGRIIFDVVQAGADDPACCPGEMATLVYTLTDGHLVAQPPQVTGRLALATVVTGPWRLLSFDPGDDVPTDVEVTLEYGDGRFSGSTGCNSYQLSVKDGDSAGAIEPGTPVATRRACDGAAAGVESRFLQCLAGVNRVSFAGPGRITMDYKVGEKYGVLTFQALGD